MRFTFARAAQVARPTDEWVGKGFEEHPFERRVLTVNEALGLRSCWAPCLPFATYPDELRWHDPQTEAGMNAGLDSMRRWAEPFDAARPIHIMSCTKALMDRLRPGHRDRVHLCSSAV
jgi:hypothetical protein